MKSKKNAPKVDETDKEAEERKAKELRQLMAEEKFKEWLSEKIKAGFQNFLTLSGALGRSKDASQSENRDFS